MDDPPAKRSDRSRTLKISRSEFEHAYDDPIRNVVEIRRANVPLNYGNRRFRGARIEEADLWIAVPDADQAPPDNPEPRVLDHDEYLGGDGVLVRLGPTWSEGNMRLQPHLRAN